MSPGDIGRIVEQAEMKFEEPPKRKNFVIERLLEPLPELLAIPKQPKPWQPPPGRGKKFHDKHNFKKRL
jgi:hypothetical protein